MAYKLNGKTLPATAPAMMRVPPLWRAFKAYVDTSLASENYLYMEARAKNKSTAALYNEFLRPNAPNFLGFVGGFLMSDITDHSDDFTHKEWKNILRTVDSNASNELTQNFINTFYGESDEFTQFLFSVIGQPRTVAKRMGIEPNGIELLGKLMRSTAMGEANNARKLGDALLRQQGIKVPLKDLIVALKKGRVIKNSKNVPAEEDVDVKIDYRALQLCGFQKAKDRKIRDLVKEMIEAHFTKKVKQAKSIYAMLQKLDPGIQGEKYEGTIKLFKRFKVVKL